MTSPLSSPFSFQAPALDDLWRHWRSLLKPGRLPRRAEIDPGAIKRILSIVWIYRLDASGRDFYCALAGEEIRTVWQRSDIIGMPIRDLFPEDVYKVLRERWLTLLDLPAVMHGSILYDRSHGDQLPLRRAERLSLPLDDAEGRRYGLIGATSYVVEPHMKSDIKAASLLPPKIVPVSEL